MKQIVARWVSMISIMFARRGGLEQRRRRAEAQREDREAAEAEGEGERRRADEDVVGRDAEHLLRVAVGDDQQVAVEMHRRLRLAGGAGGEAEQRHVVAAGRDRLEAHRLAERDAVELGVVVGGAVEADRPSSGSGSSLAQATSSSLMRVSQSARLISALSTILASSPARSIGMVLTTTAPALVAPSQQATIAGLLAERISTRLPGLTPIVLDQRVGEAVGPVGELLVGALAAVADQRDVVAEALLDHAVGQLDRGVQALGIVEAGRGRGSGHSASGGRLSRVNVSVWAVGPSIVSSPLRPASGAR